MNRRQTVLHRGVWALILLVALIGTGYKVVENSRQRSASAVWHHQIAQLTEDGMRWREQSVARLRELQGQPNARQQLEQELNSSRGFQLKDAGQLRTAAWSDPTYGAQLELTFDGDTLVGHHLNWGTSDLIRLYPEPPRVAFTSRAEQFRQLAVAWCPWVWGVALVTFLFAPRANRIFAEVMLVAALAYAVAQLLSPIYDLTLQGIFSNDGLFLAGLLLGASSLAMAWRSGRPSLRLEPSPRLVPQGVPK